MTRYRVWFHNKSGDDTYQEFSSKVQAMRVAQRTPSAEKVIYEVSGSLLKGTEKPIALKKLKPTKKRKTSFAFGNLKMPKFRL